MLHSRFCLPFTGPAKTTDDSRFARRAKVINVHAHVHSVGRFIIRLIVVASLLSPHNAATHCRVSDDDEPQPASRCLRAIILPAQNARARISSRAAAAATQHFLRSVLRPRRISSSSLAPAASTIIMQMMCVCVCWWRRAGSRVRLDVFVALAGQRQRRRLV